MLWKSYPHELDEKPLEEAYQSIDGSPPSAMPFWVWLLEDPDSPLPLPGKIDLFRHDCLHLLLKRAFSGEDEAYVVGFTLGNDPTTQWVHVVVFKFLAWLTYPPPYRFSKMAIAQFDLGYALGRKVRTPPLNRAPFHQWRRKPLQLLRQELGLDLEKDCSSNAY